MAKPAHKQTAKKPALPHGLFDPEYDAITTKLGGTFYKKPLSDPTPDIIGYALGTHALVPGWVAAKRQFHNDADAEAFLQTIIPDQPHVFDPVGARGIDEHASYNDRIKSYAADLISGFMWCLKIYPQYMVLPGLTSQAHGSHKLSEDKMAKVNTQCGTNVDMHFIWEQEGAQWLRGYCVLRGTEHVNVLRSGLTIATGFDVGTKGPREMAALGYKDPNDPVLAMLRPYLGQPFVTPIAHHGKGTAAYTDWNGGKISQFMASQGPVPVLTKDQADELDVRSFAAQINETKNFWNRHRPAPPHAGAAPPAIPHNAAPKAAPPPQAATQTAPLPHAEMPLHGAPPGAAGHSAQAAPPAPVRLKPFNQLSPAWQTVLVDWVFQHGLGAFTSLAYARAAASGDAKLAKQLLAAAGGQRPHNQSQELKDDLTTLTIDPAPAAAAPHANANRKLP